MKCRPRDSCATVVLGFDRSRASYSGPKHLQMRVFADNHGGRPTSTTSNENPRVREDKQEVAATVCCRLRIDNGSRYRAALG
jgi:hypothetical protein